MNRASLLGGTAIAALMVSAPAFAGSMGTGDNLSITFEGEVRVSVRGVDQDDSEGAGRGYGFQTDEAEFKLEARNTADAFGHPFLYGVEVVLNVNTDDVENGDKAFAFIDSRESLGRLEIGDQDDAIDRMFVAGEDALVGRAGFDGELADIFRFGDTWIGVSNNNTGKATKVTYFSERFAGFQVGASFTPDAGSQGASFGKKDNDGDPNNVIGLAANYVGEFGDFGLVVSGFYEDGDGDVSTADNPGASAEDVETYGVGLNISYAGFTFGAGWVDLTESNLLKSDSNAGADQGEWISVGLGYRSGPWGVWVGYYKAEIGIAGSVGDTENEVIAIDAEYEIAPGWLLAGSIGFNEADNRGRSETFGLETGDNDGTAGIIYNIFTF
jgi:predicted porin